MIETVTYKRVLPNDLLERYTFMETGSAAAIIAAIRPDPFSDIVNVLKKFTLTSQMLMTPGGNRGCVPRTLDGAFEHLGWMEARVDIYRRAFLFRGNSAGDVSLDPFGDRAEENLVSETYQRGYAVDNVKDRIALDVEWNPKDGNLDRDFSAYRAWHNEGLIDASVLITRKHDETKRLTDELWNAYIRDNPECEGQRQPVSYKTTTTANYEKALTRIRRGDLGSCPILVVGIGRNAWDGCLWNGRQVKYDDTLGCCVTID